MSLKTVLNGEFRRGTVLHNKSQKYQFQFSINEKKNWAEDRLQTEDIDKSCF